MSTKTGDHHDRFVPEQWCDAPLGKPFFNGAAASFKCELRDRHLYDTHEIFIGRVCDMTMQPDIEPMLYLDAKFCRAQPVN